MKIKKVISALLISSIAIFGAAVVNASGIEVYVDNEKTALSDGTGGTAEPFIQDGTTYVPLRGVSEALGCKVEWDGNNRTVKIYQNKLSSGSVFRNSDDDIMVYIDDEEVELKDANGGIVKPFIIDGTTFIPLRGVSQALGCQVEWDGSLQRVDIYQNMISPNGATLDFVRPYEINWVDVCYESEGKQEEIDGNKYTNAIIGRGGWLENNILFNLNGRYKNMSFYVGHHDNSDGDIKLTFIVDGKIIDVYELDTHSIGENVIIPLNYGLQLKIIFSGWGIGMGNIVFH